MGGVMQGYRGEAVPLSGRGREVALLREALSSALAGRGGLVLIGGEAGIGKSALAEMLLAKAIARGALVLVGRCYDLTETPPYGPWREALAALPHCPPLPPLPAALATTGAGLAVSGREATFAQARLSLRTRATERPIVLLLDDLHWADPASLDLLRVVGRDLRDQPILIMTTYRADEVSRQHPLAPLLPLLAREGRAILIDLGPLGDVDLRDVVRGRYTLIPADETRLVTYLVARSEGNPFYAKELLRALKEEHALAPAGEAWALGDLAQARMSPLLRQVLDERVDRLGEGGRALLTIAAVIGQDVPLDLLQSVAEWDEEGLLTVVEAATAAQLLIATDEGARFAHTLIREALYGALSPPRRRSWHRRLGEALAATGTPDPDTVAYHFRQGGDPRAVAWLVRAGERAQAAYAWLSAADRFEAALLLIGERGDTAGERAVLLVRLGQLRRFADRSRSLEHLDQALALAGVAGDRALAVYARYQRGNVRCLALDYGGGLADEATALAEWAGLSDDERVRVAGPGGLDPHYGRANYANWCALAGRYAEVLAIAEDYPAAAIVPPRGMLVDVGYADLLQGKGYACAALGQPEEASRALAAARVAYRAAQHHEMVAETGRNDLGWVVLPYQADQPIERRRVLAEVEEAEAHIAGVLGDLPPHYARKAILLAEGRWAEATTLAQALRAVGISHEWLVGTVTLARLARERGERDRAHQLVREALPDGPGGTPGDRHYFYQLDLQRLAVDLALDDGDLATARIWLAAHDRWLAWSGAVLGRADAALGWAAYHRAAGDLAAAWWHAEAALAHAGEPRQSLALLAAQRLLGELDFRAGRQADAETWLAAALALADACAAPYERALTLLAQAELRAANGPSDEVGALLDEVRAICTPLGARPLLARVEAVAPGPENGARSGTRPTTNGTAANLSPREVTVLHLLANGRSNKEIAGHLGISVRTAERHIANIYAKIDAAGRAEAIAYAHRHGLA